MKISTHANRYDFGIIFMLLLYIAKCTQFWYFGTKSLILT